MKACSFHQFFPSHFDSLPKFSQSPILPSIISPHLRLDLLHSNLFLLLFLFIIYLFLFFHFICVCDAIICYCIHFLSFFLIVSLEYYFLSPFLFLLYYPFMSFLFPDNYILDFFHFDYIFQLVDLILMWSIFPVLC